MSGHFPQRRRDKRFPVRLVVKMRIGGSLREISVDDVSFRGLFLRVDTALPLRQLIKIETKLPPNEVPFATHGMVIHVIAPGDPSGRAAGAGVQFYGMGDERRAWEAYVQHIQRTAAPLPDRRTTSVPPPIPQPSRVAKSG